MARMTLPPGMAMHDVLAVLPVLVVAIFLWTAKDRQTLESLWKISCETRSRNITVPSLWQGTLQQSP